MAVFNTGTPGSIGQVSNTANTIVPAPTPIANGDILLLLWSCTDVTSTPTPTPPSGFTGVGGSSSGLLYSVSPYSDIGGEMNVLYAWWKRASSESGSYTITHSAPDGINEGVCLCYRGALGSGDPSVNPNSTINSFAPGDGSASAIVANGGTATAGSMVIFVMSAWGFNGSSALPPPTGSSPVFNLQYTDSITLGELFVYDGATTSAGATGNKSPNNTSFGGGWGASLIFIENAKQTLMRTKA